MTQEIEIKVQDGVQVLRFTRADWCPAVTRPSCQSAASKASRQRATVSASRPRTADMAPAPTGTASCM